jgi:hypothetical protein
VHSVGPDLARGYNPRAVTWECHARRRAGALTVGSLVAGQHQGAAEELAGATGRAPGKAVGGGAHPSGGTA